MTIIARCRDVLEAIAEARPLPAIAEKIAGVQALVQAIDGEVVAYGLEKRSTRFGRLHVLACRLIDRTLHDVVADLARLAASPPRDGDDARKARTIALDRRLEALADAISTPKPLVRGAVAGATEEAIPVAPRVRSPEIDDLHADLDRLTIATARYRRILRKDAEGAYA